MNRILTLAAIVEAVTGVALIINPSLVTELLLGAEISGAAVAVGRFAGIGLFALGLACWPGASPRSALLIFNVLVTLFLLFVGLHGEWVGRFLWPTVVLHAVLTVFLARAWFEARKTAGRK